MDCNILDSDSVAQQGSRIGPPRFLQRTLLVPTRGLTRVARSLNGVCDGAPSWKFWGNIAITFWDFVQFDSLHDAYWQSTDVPCASPKSAYMTSAMTIMGFVRFRPNPWDWRGEWKSLLQCSSRPTPVQLFSRHLFYQRQFERNDRSASVARVDKVPWEWTLSFVVTVRRINWR